MIKVRIPATTANLGPGFDSLGLALDLYNEFYFEEIEKGLEIIGCLDKYNNEDNLIYKSMLKTFSYIGYKNKGIRIKVISNIPESRGLGSSASCILAGVIGANKIANNKLTKEEIFKIATEIEGHPDNIAPALFGGLIASIVEGDNIYYNNINVAEGLKFIALIPEFTLSTFESRNVLPSEVDYKDAVYNVTRTNLLISALINGKFDLIKYGLKDKLHQPYRAKLINNYNEIVEYSNKIGALGTYLSGAGPTIMCIVREEDISFKDNIENFLSNFLDKWEVKELRIDNIGAVLS